MRFWHSEEAKTSPAIGSRKGLSIHEGVPSRARERGPVRSNHGDKEQAEKLFSQLQKRNPEGGQNKESI